MSADKLPLNWFERHGLDSSTIDPHGGRWQAAVELARAAGDVTLKYFQTDRFEVIRKSDESPVTIADQQAEQFIRSELAKRFPADAILGEEFGSQAGSGDYQWILDPIDGTKSFIYGVPLYSTLVGVTYRGEATIGVIVIPGLDEMVYACRGLGAYHQRGSQPPIRTHVSKQADLGSSLFVTSQVDTFDKRDASAAFQHIQKRAYVTRTWGDAYGYLLVATGRADVMVDPKVNPWDVAAVQPVIEEAGGVFTDWNGNPTIHGGDGVGTNGLLHQEILKLLKA